MRRTTIFLTSAALLLAPLSAVAKTRGFDTTIASPLTAPVKIEVVLSDDLAHRANNLPEKLSDRGGARSLRSGFSGNGFYGDQALQSLLDEVSEELTEDLTRQGVAVSDEAEIVLRVTLEDVRNNRPTFEQLSREPGLSFDSFGVGGAELSSQLLDADGDELGTMTYRWFETTIDPAGFARANGVWTDAHRAISRFSRKAAKTLS